MFIQGFTSVAVTLTALIKKNLKFILGSNCQESLDKLKQALTFASVLLMPSRQGENVLYADASKLGSSKELPDSGPRACNNNICFEGMETLLISGEKELNMRQRRWLELVKGYDCEISYHLGTANVVADAFSRKTAVIVQLIVHRPLQEDIQLFEIAVYARGEAPNLSTMPV
ncbi:uncharacterized protein LOC142541910 [Primulina tabacum]|uniref:uncharacterized protein LOC142541910 n=1 Tax=Primulina tabacum TaxID=48773 RepID=UPI003F59C67C